MTRRYVYFSLFVIGSVLPYVSFIPWVIDHGLDISRMVEELFVNRISAFFGLDVIVSTIVLWVFVNWEGRRVGVPQWPAIVASLTIGVSSALPLFLFLRESRIQPAFAPKAPSAL
jgi:hypothetical protein